MMKTYAEVDVYNQLKEMIKAEHCPDDQFVLSETVRDTVLSIQIRNHQGAEFFLCKFDNDEADLYPFLVPQRGIQKMCDYILFALLNGKLYTLLIELKAGTGQSNAQLDAGKVLVALLYHTVIRQLKDKQESLQDHEITTYLAKLRLANIQQRGRKRRTGSPLIPDSRTGGLIMDLDHLPLRKITKLLDDSSMTSDFRINL